MPQVPFAFQWTISENELLPLKDSINGYLFSTSITRKQNFEYYLGIYPNGNKEEYRGQTKLYLYLKLGDVQTVEADYSFSIESTDKSVEGRFVFEENGGWGYYICSTNDLFDPEKKFIINGKFTVKVNGIFKFETENDAIPSAIKEQKWVGAELGDELWENDEIKDFTIIASDGKEIKTHRLIIWMRSEVFKAMLNANMKESIENKVTIPDFAYNVIETGIKLIYQCTFTSSLSIHELMSLQQFLDKYQCPSLKAKVEPLLINQISPSTVVRLTNCSVQTNSFKLKEKCMEYLSAAFASKTPLADIDDLDKDIALDILKNSLYRIVHTEK